MLHQFRGQLFKEIPAYWAFFTRSPITFIPVKHGDGLQHQKNSLFVLPFTVRLFSRAHAASSLLCSLHNRIVMVPWQKYRAPVSEKANLEFIFGFPLDVVLTNSRISCSQCHDATSSLHVRDLYQSWLQDGMRTTFACAGGVADHSGAHVGRNQVSRTLLAVLLSLGLTFSKVAVVKVFKDVLTATYCSDWKCCSRRKFIDERIIQHYRLSR